MATVVSIANGGFAINGTPTYPGRRWKGHRIEGLLFNSRMANAIADDENPATRGAWAYADGDWDAERSAREFIAALPSYRAHGLLAVCLNLSGGSPQGYSWNQPWKICGFTPAGTIKPAWAARLEKVISACDRLGMVVRSEEHTSELQSPCNLVCRLLLEKKKKKHLQILDYQKQKNKYKKK